MPFIPHTEADINKMLETIGAADISALFDEVPQSLSEADLSEVASGCNEMEISRIMQERAPEASSGRNFIGAGAYEHYIPAAVWQIAGRGEFYTAYTPYQAEASQGSLQLIYEYQTMMAELMCMDVSNASLYDGATSLSESCLMAVRIKKSKANKILMPRALHPAYQRVLKTILKQQSIELIPVDFDVNTGSMDLTAIDQSILKDTAAIIIAQPNFFGIIEDVDKITAFARSHNVLVIASINPTAMALLKPPGQWGEDGADIVCGEGQPLGVPLSYGEPYVGLMCCKKQFVRQMPGRLVGRTIDKSGNDGYTLTLQAREQHIRRQKATSNICTNQGLLVVAATLYLSLLGAEGLEEVAKHCHHNAVYLRDQLAKIPGVKIVFSDSFWHEFVISLPKPVNEVMALMQDSGIQCGFELTNDYPEIENALLICATETKTKDDLDQYARAMNAVIVTLLSKELV